MNIEYNVQLNIDGYLYRHKFCRTPFCASKPHRGDASRVDLALARDDVLQNIPLLPPPPSKPERRYTWRGNT